MQQRLVLWDVDHTLVNAGGLSGHCYGLVFRRRYGRELENPASMQGRTDRAIVGDTLRRNGIDDSDAEVEAALAAGAAVVAVACGTYGADQLWEAGAHAVLPDLGDTDHVVETILKVSA